MPSGFASRCHWIDRLGTDRPVDFVDRGGFGIAPDLDVESEIFSTQFACSLLTPAELVIDHAPDAGVEEIAERFRVPASMMDLRIVDLSVH